MPNQMRGRKGKTRWRIKIDPHLKREALKKSDALDEALMNAVLGVKEQG